jgi:hypothetical protein
MLIKYVLLVIILLVIVYFVYNNLYNNQDHFTPSPMANLSPRSIYDKIHVEVDKNGNITSKSFKPPSAHGISHCAIVPCPTIPIIDIIEDNVLGSDNYVCWSCCNYD